MASAGEFQRAGENKLGPKRKSWIQSLSLQEQAERLKGNIKEWKSSLTDIGPARIKTLQEKMNEWDKKAELSVLSDFEQQDFIAAKEQALVLKQRSRVKWAVEGDENSAFFHGSIKGRMKRNTIRGLAVNGVWLDDLVSLKEEVYGFFQRHLTES